MNRDHCDLPLNGLVPPLQTSTIPKLDGATAFLYDQKSSHVTIICHQKHPTCTKSHHNLASPPLNSLNSAMCLPKYPSRFFYPLRSTNKQTPCLDQSSRKLMMVNAELKLMGNLCKFTWTMVHFGLI